MGIRTVFAIVVAMAMLPAVVGTSSLTTLQNFNPAGGLAVYEIDLESNATGYLSYETPTLFGKLYAVEWTNTSTSLSGDNTLYINASSPYAFTLASYNMTNVTTGYREYPREDTDKLVPIRSALTFGKANDTSEMTATVYLYLER